MRLSPRGPNGPGAPPDRPGPPPAGLDGDIACIHGPAPDRPRGGALARLEGRVALDELLQRFPEWEVDLDAARMSPTSTVRGWETLPVTVR